MPPSLQKQTRLKQSVKRKNLIFLIVYRTTEPLEPFPLNYFLVELNEMRLIFDIKTFSYTFINGKKQKNPLKSS